MVPRQAGESPEDDEYVTTGEAARLLGVAPRTVARWADEGRIAYIVTLGGHRRFARSVIQETRAWMEQEPS